ncbi:hypothetical protein [Streptomyces sp. NPDC002611]
MAISAVCVITVQTDRTMHRAYFSQAEGKLSPCGELSNELLSGEAVWNGFDQRSNGGM